MPRESSRDPGAAGNRIILRANRATTMRLRLVGPTTLEEGRTLAARINGIIAQYNTLYFKQPDGTEILPKITARTTDT